MEEEVKITEVEDLIKEDEFDDDFIRPGDTEQEILPEGNEYLTEPCMYCRKKRLRTRTKKDTELSDYARIGLYRGGNVYLICDNCGRSQCMAKERGGA